MPDQHDVVIVGAGPAGLSAACALADRGLGVALVERSARAALAAPPSDGREIALTHRSRAILAALGIWERFAPAAIAPIRAARVGDGRSPRYLGFEPPRAGVGALGYLVPNAVIRRAAFEAAMTRPLRLFDGAQVQALRIAGDRVRVELSDGGKLEARVLIAADGRFSETRRRLGIGAEQRDFGRAMIVCRLAHERPSDGIAYECFGYGRTLAMLPLNDRQVSAVITVASDRAGALLRMPPREFAANVEAQFGSRLGALRLLGERHAYPLVAVYAQRFATRRAALLGDAAVGMHPVTAHGFNLGLYGAEMLARVLGDARRGGRDIGALPLLSAYEREHRRTARPLYLGTNALVALYTDEQLPARLLRRAVLRAADRLPPLKRAITRRLTDAPRAPFPA